MFFIHQKILSICQWYKTRSKSKTIERRNSTGSTSLGEDDFPQTEKNSKNCT